MLAQKFQTDVVKMSNLIALKDEVNNCIKTDQIIAVNTEMTHFRKVIAAYMNREELEQRFFALTQDINDKLSQRLTLTSFNEIHGDINNRFDLIELTHDEQFKEVNRHLTEHDKDIKYITEDI